MKTENKLLWIGGLAALVYVAWSIQNKKQIRYATVAAAALPILPP